jgi:mono/diheme cytochrome c family protein
MSFRTILILFNLALILGFAGFVIYRVVSVRRNPEPKEPDNLTPFFEDDVLEGAHLERALGVSLIALVVVVLALLAYFIWEPFREADANAGFKDRSIERGAVLFADSSSPEYDSTKSLLCATCHGSDGGGGSAPNFVIKSEDPLCDPNQKVDAKLAENNPECLPHSVAWAAPNLQVASLKYDRAQLTQIITYGRPGTPMPAWGVLSGKGALQEQSIQDLVNYVESLATTPDKAQAASTKELETCNRAACVGRDRLQKPTTRAAAAAWVVDAQAQLDQAQAELAESSVADVAKYAKLVQEKQETLQVAQDWQETTQSVSDGQLLFMNNCARCHTRGWSYFNPEDPNPEDTYGNLAPGIMGGGAYGPNLTGGDVNNQFPPPSGESELFSWISIGVPANQQYGIRGISSGRMPHFGATLSKDQIEAIMAYERSL